MFLELRSSSRASSATEREIQVATADELLKFPSSELNRLLNAPFSPIAFLKEVFERASRGDLTPESFSRPQTQNSKTDQDGTEQNNEDVNEPVVPVSRHK